MHVTARQAVIPKPCEVEEETSHDSQVSGLGLQSTKIQQVAKTGDLVGKGMDNKFRLF